MMRSIRIILLFLFYLLSSKSFSQDALWGFYGECNYTFTSRQSYALGMDLELPIGKKCNSFQHFYLNIQHGIGINNDLNRYHLYLQSTMPLRGFYSFVSQYPNRHTNHSQNGAGALALLFFLPNGITYYFPVIRSTPVSDNLLRSESRYRPIDKIGIYINPNSYQLWMLPDGHIIDAYVFEFGLKYLKHIHERFYMNFSLGTNYSISMGKQELLPLDYENGILLNTKIMFMWR